MTSSRTGKCCAGPGGAFRQPAGRCRDRTSARQCAGCTRVGRELTGDAQDRITMRSVASARPPRSVRRLLQGRVPRRRLGHVLPEAAVSGEPCGDVSGRRPLMRCMPFPPGVRSVLCGLPARRGWLCGAGHPSSRGSRSSVHRSGEIKGKRSVCRVTAAFSWGVVRGRWPAGPVRRWTNASAGPASGKAAGGGGPAARAAGPPPPSAGAYVLTRPGRLMDCQRSTGRSAAGPGASPVSAGTACGSRRVHFLMRPA